jgi:predicted Ser/Thr protein kinase
MLNELILRAQNLAKESFKKEKRVLSFQQYLELVEDEPYLQLRSSAQYTCDAFDYFGKDKERFKLFDLKFDEPKHRVFGQTEVQNEIYKTLKNFVHEGLNNRLILLHGPNGSSKSSIVNAMMKALEFYSKTQEGALYKFNWIFPIDKISKGGFGLASKVESNTHHYESYAFLNDDEIACKIPCELKDHPLLLLPKELRLELFNEIQKKDIRIKISDYLKNGSLSHKSKTIFESLFNSYQGDLKKVLMHIQVERFYISKRYRSSAVSIEPQMHVDASVRQISIDKNIVQLPVSLQNLNLFEATGDLIDANRGILEFADLLKRPLDTFKYLLSTCETGLVNLGPIVANLDEIFIGSANELELDAFKEYPDFMSFKARFHLIRVPYLLKVSEEKQIYDAVISNLSQGKFVTPHTTYVVALWAVLTRLKKCNPSIYSSPLSEIVANLKPIEKAKLYDDGTLPDRLSSEDKKILKANIQKIFEEYAQMPNYEGRIGASAREMKTLIFEAASQTQYKTLSPISIFQELEKFVKRVSEYEFLREDIKDGYHDAKGFIETVKQEYLNIIDHEVKESIGLISQTQYEEYLKKYITHVSHLLKKEKIKNPITGKNEDPDFNLIEEFEMIINPTMSQQEKERFRTHVISTIGAYALENPKEQIIYSKIFPDFIKKIDSHYFEKQKDIFKKIGEAIELLDIDSSKIIEATNLAKTTIENMISKFGYSKDCAPLVITFLIKNRYK